MIAFIYDVSRKCSMIFRVKKILEQLSTTGFCFTEFENRVLFFRSSTENGGNFKSSLISYKDKDRFYANKT